MSSKYFIEYLGHRGPETTFVIGFENCQNIIDDALDKNDIESWIQLKKVLQNFEGKAIATMLAEVDQNPIIVKVQLGDDSLHEFHIADKLRQNNIDGFRNYLCMFTCNDTKRAKEYIHEYGAELTIPKQQLCISKGSGISIIMMPYYHQGNLELLYRNNKISIDNLYKAINQVIQNVFLAYKKTDFIHGDLFLKNILLDDNKNRAYNNNNK